MTRYYIKNKHGDVVAQFDKEIVDIKDGHEMQIVDDIDDLPGVDSWDTDYEL